MGKNLKGSEELKLSREDKNFLKKYCGCGWRDIRAIEKKMDLLKIHLEDTLISFDKAARVASRAQILQCIDSAIFSPSGSSSALLKDGRTLSFDISPRNVADKRGR